MGQKFQLNFARARDWSTYKSYHRHKFKEGIIPVNMVFSILRAMVPQIYLRNPRVSVPSTRPGMQYELNARIVQHLDNWFIRELALKYEFKKLIADNFFCGIASAFDGYDATTSTKSTGRFNPTVQLKDGMPWFLRARPEDVVFPWGCADKDTAEWVALRIFRKVSDLKADKTYSNTDTLKGDITPKRTGPEGEIYDAMPLDQQISTDSEDVQWVEIWEVHDSRSGKLYAVTKDIDKFLRDEEDPAQIEGLPVYTIVFNPDPDYIYGIPDVRILEPQLLELNEIRTQAMKHRRIDLAKLITKKGVFSPEEKQKMMSEQVQSVAEADVDVALRDAVMPAPNMASGIMQDMAFAGSIAQADIREAVGFSRVAQGEYQGKTHISSEETKRVFQALNIRLDERRDLIVDTLSFAIRKFNQYIFKNWTGRQAAQVIGPDGAKYWIGFTGKEIKDEYNLSVEVEEGLALDSKTRLDMAVAAGKAWAEMNQGAVKAGIPVPMEIQRAVFMNIPGIDSDRLLAQIEQMNETTKKMMAGGIGQNPAQPVPLPEMAQMMGGGQ